MWYKIQYVSTAVAHPRFWIGGGLIIALRHTTQLLTKLVQIELVVEAVWNINHLVFFQWWSSWIGTSNQFSNYTLHPLVKTWIPISQIKLKVQLCDESPCVTRSFSKWTNNERYQTTTWSNIRKVVTWRNITNNEENMQQHYEMCLEINIKKRHMK